MLREVQLHQQLVDAREHARRLELLDHLPLAMPVLELRLRPKSAATLHVEIIWLAESCVVHNTARSTSGAPVLPDSMVDAVQRGQLASVIKWLDSGGCVDARDPGGNTMLLGASPLGAVTMVEALLQRGAAVDVANQHGETALILAFASSQSEAMVTALLQHGASVSVNMQNYRLGATALMIASQKNQLAVVRKLFAAGADPTLRTKLVRLPDGSPDPTEDRSRTAADIAEKSGHAAVVNAIYAHPPMLLLPPETERGVRRNKVGAIRAWMRDGGHVDARGTEAMTMLMLSCRNGFDSLVTALLQRGASVNLQNEHGDTALNQASGKGGAVSSQRREMMVAALLKRGANVHLQARNGGTALMCASQNNHIAIVRQLLAAGADPAQRDHKGWTAADLAPVEYTAVLKLLCERPGAGRLH